jgi:hypothetical protein
MRFTHTSQEEIFGKLISENSGLRRFWGFSSARNLQRELVGSITKRTLMIGQDGDKQREANK